MKRFIKFAAILSVLSLVFVIAVSAAGSKLKPTDRFFVNDFASVISETDESVIFQKGENLYNACKAQAVVVTVDTLGGVPIEDYAYNLANEWGLGDKEKDNGILILLSVNDREVRIEVGSGLEGALPDSKTGRILDRYGMDYFAADNFSAGLVSVYNSVVNEIYIEYGLEPDKNYVPVGDDEFGIFEIIILVIIVLVLIFGRFRGGRGGIFFFPMFFGRGGYYGGNGGGFSGGFGSGGFSGGGGGFSGGGAGRKF